MVSPQLTGTVILTWNDEYLNRVRKVRFSGAPGPIARVGALMHVAMYEVVRRLTLPAPPYPELLPIATVQAEVQAADAADPALGLPQLLQNNGLDAAGVEVLRADVAAGYAASFVLNANDPMGIPLPVVPGEEASRAIGEAIAKAVLAHRSGDQMIGFDKVPNPAFGIPSKLAVNPDAPLRGEWRETGSGMPVTPNWGKLARFATGQPIQPGDGVLPTVLPTRLDSYEKLLPTPDYTLAFNEVALLGAKDSVARTPEQTEIAFFWANDLDGTSKPPGQLYTITRIVAEQQGTTGDLLETARLFAWVAVAMLDASIVAWYVKYFWPAGPASTNRADLLRLWRPESAVQQALTDGNMSTATEPRWQPLSAKRDGSNFSPSFPAYVSGHATFGAAHARAMRDFYKRDDIAFTATTEDPHATRDANGVVRTRDFKSFTEAALENGRSRVYLGVHYQWDANGGYQAGIAVADAVAGLFNTPA